MTGDDSKGREKQDEQVVCAVEETVRKENEIQHIHSTTIY